MNSQFRSGKDYATSRVGERGTRDMDNKYEHDALAQAFEAGRESRKSVLFALMVLVAKLSQTEDGASYGSGITNGEVWQAVNAIAIDEGRQPNAPNNKYPTILDL
jgi:hypothetical protein